MKRSIILQESCHHILLSNLPDSIVTYLFQFLDHISILKVSLCSSFLWSLGSSDHVWKVLCERLWRSKVHNPFLGQCKHFKSLFFRSRAIEDLHIIHKSLLNDRFWSMRFKKEAGDEWIDSCPWHQGKDPALVKFVSDGTIQRYNSAKIPLNDSLDYSQGVFEPDERLDFEVSWSLDWKNKGYEMQMLKRTREILAHLWRISLDLDSLIPIERKLKVDQFLHCSTNQVISEFARDSSFGNIIRVKVNGVYVPTYFISRSPTGNWGYLLESCWALYASWKLPKKGECLCLEDDYLQMTTDMQVYEIRRYNREISMVQLLDDGDDEDE